MFVDHRDDLNLTIFAAGEIFGGAERQILTLARAMASDCGAMPTLMLFHDRRLADEARRLGIPVRVLGARGLIDFQVIRQLREGLRERSLGTISVHGYRASVYLALAAAGQPISVVKTEHGGVEVLGSRAAQRLRPRFYRWLENVATRQLKAIVVYVTQELQRKCSSEHSKLQKQVIYNGVEPIERASTMRPPEFDASGAMNLVTVGRLDRVKGLDVAIRALANKAMPSRVRLYLVGSGPELAELTGLARELDVIPQVSFLGFQQNVYNYVAHADALLMPSHHEGLPYTLLEALTLGTPVIASRVGGLAEVLTDRQTALLVEPGKPAALAEAVRILAETPALGEKMTRNGRALVAASFTADEMARQYQSLFESVRKSGALR